MSGMPLVMDSLNYFRSTGDVISLFWLHIIGYDLVLAKQFWEGLHNHLCWHRLILLSIMLGWICILFISQLFNY